ncbi:unnamed protein product [Dibothriocephalus latus]|uniref:Uncharacterized protein n=1 Tax=Dibothriocephalus latus TaxID=60516 RepID=A0A3P7NZL7_DIBLA|nr:unnamed protein product [Dibothriocephalus latus]
MVHTASSVSLIPPSQFSYQEVATKSEPLPEESQLPFKIESPSASPQSYHNGPLAADDDLPKPEGLKDENADGEALPIRQPKLSKRKESKRSWRLSEPFTVRFPCLATYARIRLGEILIECDSVY